MLSEEREYYLIKAIAAADKAFSIHTLPIYFYELATYLDLYGNIEIAKKIYAGFLDMQTKFKDDKKLGILSEFFYNDLAVDEAIKDAKSKIQ